MQYLLGVRAGLRLLRGDWRAAEADAHAALELGEQPGVSLCPALIVLGRLRARRGDPEALATIDEALAAARSRPASCSGSAPAAAARAEHAWLDGDLDARRRGRARDPRARRAPRRRVGARRARLVAVAGGRAGRRARRRPAPYARAIAGDWRGAAAVWAALGFPYERAEALADADDEDARLEALRVFDDLGAARAASRLRRRLRADGVRHIPRGPRPASRAGPAGLTPRQVEVLDLLAAGATNAEIAETLVITPKTVDHHVSAVLGKLGVTSRREAGAAQRPAPRLQRRRASPTAEQVLHLEPRAVLRSPGSTRRRSGRGRRPSRRRGRCRSRSCAP